MLKFSSNRTARAGVIGLAGAVLVAGCAAVGPNFHRPAASTAPGYAMSGDDPDTGGDTAAVLGDKVVANWWALFQSPALDQIMRQAIANNRTLEQARARLAQARAASQTQGGLLSADATAGAKRERANLNAFSGGAFSGSSLGGFNTNPEFNLYSVGASVSYNLDLFGGERRRRESLAATAEARARELDAAYLTLTGQVVQQALIIADATLQTQALRDIAQRDQTMLTMLRGSQSAGGAAATDIAAAEMQLAQDSASLPVQTQRLAAARHQLAVLVGKAPSEWSPPDFDPRSGALPSVLLVAVPSALVHGRPDILEAEARLHAATAAIGVADAARYPNITLSASYAIDALTPESFFKPITSSWALGPALTTPLFHSGELKARQREAEAAARVALATYQQTVLEAFAQVADGLQAVVHDNQTYAERQGAVTSATARLDSLRGGYRLGGVSALQVVEAERGWRQAQLALSLQGANRYADAARLLLATATVPVGAADPGPR